MRVILAIFIIININVHAAQEEDCTTTPQTEAFRAVTERISNSNCISDSDTQENAPVQVAASGTPAGADKIKWNRPSADTSWGPFTGTPGSKAKHEGIDYIHADQKVRDVNVYSAANGTVAYVRTGCPQSSMFKHNNHKRECGSGWGNHVIVHHGNGIYTRYAHLAPNSINVRVGQRVNGSNKLAHMGNSGRSERRHLHFEMGSGILRGEKLDPCAGSKSFNRIYDPKLAIDGKFALSNSNNPTTSKPSQPKESKIAAKWCKVATSSSDGYMNVRSGAGTTNRILRPLDNGSSVKIVSESGNWYGVEFKIDGVNYGKANGKPAYIFKNGLNCGNTSVSIDSTPKTTPRPQPVATPAPTPRPTPRPTSNNNNSIKPLPLHRCKVIINDSSGWANVRKGPSSQYSVVDELNEGDIVRATGFVGSWLSVEYHTVNGSLGASKGRPVFIHSSLLKCKPLNTNRTSTRTSNNNNNSSSRDDQIKKFAFGVLTDVIAGQIRR